MSNKKKKGALSMVPLGKDKRSSKGKRYSVHGFIPGDAGELAALERRKRIWELGGGRIRPSLGMATPLANKV